MNTVTCLYIFMCLYHDVMEQRKSTVDLLCWPL